MKTTMAGATTGAYRFSPLRRFLMPVPRVSAHRPLPQCASPLVHVLVFAALLIGAAGMATAEAATARVIPLFTSAASPQQTFARIINHSDEPGEVRIEAIDDAGMRYGLATLTLEAGETRHFNSSDLERGNSSRGLSGGVGDGQGHWRLALKSDLNFEALAYVRTQDGFLTSMHDLAPASTRGEGSRHRIATFNPGSNRNQVSSLRLSNPGDVPAAVVITGTDDRGSSPGEAVRLTLEAGTSRTLSAQALESGDGVEGFLGDGMGKWELTVETDQPIHAMSLLSSPTGHLTNLSAIPPGRNTFVPLFPDARRPAQGFVRVVNHSDEAGVVRIVATDDAGESYPPVSLSIAAGQTVHLTSEDLESGNAAKGVTGRHRCRQRRLAPGSRRRPEHRGARLYPHRGRIPDLDARSGARPGEAPSHRLLQSGQQPEPGERVAADQSRRGARGGRHHRHRPTEARHRASRCG